MNCTPQQCLIPGAVGELEILVSCPKPTQVDTRNIYAVICHPHPLYGGTMDNKVVYTIANTFNWLGVGAIRFNFRGVGKSSGKFAHGEGEAEDLQAVVTWLHTYYHPQELWLAGYSFGGGIALRAHQAVKANRLLLVSPAVERFNFADLLLSNIPTLVIQGCQDEVVRPEALTEWATQQTYHPQLQWIPDADHFFHGRLNKLREIITHAWG